MLVGYAMKLIPLLVSVISLTLPLAQVQGSSAQKFDQVLQLASKEQKKCVAIYRKAVAEGGALIDNTDQCPEKCFQSRGATFGAIEMTASLPVLKSGKDAFELGISVDLAKSPAEAIRFLEMHRKWLAEMSGDAKVTQPGEVEGDPKERFCASIGFYRLFEAAIETSLRQSFSDTDKQKVVHTALGYLKNSAMGPPVLASYLLHVALLKKMAEVSFLKLSREQRVELDKLIKDGDVLKEREMEIVKMPMLNSNQKRSVAISLVDNLRKTQTSNNNLLEWLRDL